MPITRVGPNEKIRPVLWNRLADAIEAIPPGGDGTPGNEGDIKATVGGVITNVKPGVIDLRARGVTTVSSDESTDLIALATEAATNGAKLWFPEGVYRGAIPSMPSNLDLDGPGTLKAPTGLASTRDQVLGFDGVRTGISVRGITVDGNGEVSGFRFGGTSAASPATNIHIDRVTVENTGTAANKNQAVFSNFCDGVRVDRLTARDIGAGIIVWNSHHVVADHCDIDGPSLDNAISFLMLASGFISEGLQATFNTIRSASRMGIEVWSGDAGRYAISPLIQGNVIDTVYSTTTNDGTTGFGISLDAGLDGTVDGNTVTRLTTNPGETYAGIELLGVGNSAVDNTVHGYAHGVILDYAEQAIVARNKLARQYDVAIRVTGNNNRHHTIEANQVRQFRKHGIDLEGDGGSANEGGHKVFLNVINRNLAWAGDGTFDWDGMIISAQGIPSKIHNNTVIQGETAPTTGGSRRGIGVVNGSAGDNDDTEIFYNQFISRSAAGFTSRLWGGGSLGDVLLLGNKAVDSAGAKSDVTSF